MTDHDAIIVHTRRYVFKHPRQDPYVSCTFEAGGWRFREHARCNFESPYRGMLLIDDVYGAYHRLDVMTDGSIQRFGETIGRWDDLEEA